SLTVYQPFIESGDLIPLGVATLEPLDALPGVPPIAQDLPGFDSSPVNYLSVPGGTPDAIVEKLNVALNKVLADPELKNRMPKAGLLPAGNTAAEMQQLVEAEQAKWKKVIEVSGAKID